MIETPARARSVARVVVLDDDPSFGNFMEVLLERNGHVCRSFTRVDEAFDALRHEQPDVLVLDYRLEECEGTELIAPILERAPDLPILLLTAHSSSDVAMEAIRVGAYDFLTKPIDEGRLTASIARAVEHRRLLNRVASIDATHNARDFEGMLGQSPRMQTLFHVVRNVAPTGAAVMIRGSSGTGKEMVARAIHNRSDRRDGPFVALNMAALPKDLVEATLFGHERGAFTGANARRIGACEEASGGTLFLDEICEMPLELQAKLLRVLQESVFRRVGGSTDLRTDARIVSATNRDPIAEVRAGRFREDLYYRLNVVPVDVPDLRERSGDIELICRHMLEQLNARHDSNFRDIDPAALELLCDFPWPGNVRQLLHVMERIVILHDGPYLSATMLPEEITHTAASAFSSSGQRVESTTEPEAANGLETSESKPKPESILPLDQVERRAIEQALDAFGGSVADAANALRISQATVYRKIKTYKIDRTRFGS